jgi:hypothetical protein
MQRVGGAPAGAGARLLQLSGVVDAAGCAQAVAVLDAGLRRAHDGAVPAEDWSRTSSSLRWRALPALAASTLAAVEERVRGVAGAAAWRLALEASWWRRQYPPQLAPPHHHPHAWHQDGALGFDFVACPGGADASALRPMLTCWIALVTCGVDAPGLELIDAAQRALLGLAALDDAALRAAHAPAAFRRPVLAAGDALLFDGSVPHRTHVSAAMTGVRSSVELRFFADELSPRACAPRSAS